MELCGLSAGFRAVARQAYSIACKRCRMAYGFTSANAAFVRFQADWLSRSQVSPGGLLRRNDRAARRLRPSTGRPSDGYLA